MDIILNREEMKILFLQDPATEEDGIILSVCFY